MPEYVVSRLVNLAKASNGSSLAILGVAYKAGISDVRESPAEHVAKAILKSGFRPLWKDPLVSKFHDFEEFADHSISGAIVVTAQPGLPVKELAEKGIPILDCTGAFKGISGVEQL
jgi:UDP-N-acetyl-D-mannosaminuronate dehydrogenase